MLRTHNGDLSGWLYQTRIDIVRKVLCGGREPRTPLLVIIARSLSLHLLKVRVTCKSWDRNDIQYR